MKLKIIISIMGLLLLLQGASFAITVKDGVFKTANAGTVLFSHREHLKVTSISKNCRACHDEIFSLRKKVRSTMAEMEKGKSCGACHNGKKGFPLKDCLRCHRVKEVRFENKSYGTVNFSHKSHMEAHTCSDCHNSIYKASRSKTIIPMKLMEQGKSCGACHNGRGAFSLKECLKCHRVKEVRFEGPSYGAVDFSHKSHMEAHTCSDCHNSIYKASRSKAIISMKQMEQGKSCGACHNGRGGFPLKECLKCHHAEEVLFEEKSTGNVRFSHTKHLDAYGCADCHPGTFKTARSTVKVSMEGMEKGKSCGSCHDGKTVFSVKEKCEACHKI